MAHLMLLETHASPSCFSTQTTLISKIANNLAYTEVFLHSFKHRLAYTKQTARKIICDFVSPSRFSPSREQLNPRPSSISFAFSLFPFSGAAESTTFQPQAHDSFNLSLIQKVGSCSYTVLIKTSCSSTKYTRDQINLSFGDAYVNQSIVDIKTVLSQLMDRLSNYSASSPDVLPELLHVEAFTKLSNAIGKEECVKKLSGKAELEDSRAKKTNYSTS